MLGSAAWLEADRSAAGRVQISHEHAQAATDAVGQQLAISVYEPLWATCTDAEKEALRMIALAEFNKRAAGSPQLSWDSVAFRLMGNLYRLVGNGIIWPHSRPRGQPVEFVIAGFADYVLLRSAGMAQPSA